MALKAEEVYAILKKQMQSGGATPEQIRQAVDAYLEENPVQPGATVEQAAQIEKNKTDISELSEDIDKLDNTLFEKVSDSPNLFDYNTISNGNLNKFGVLIDNDTTKGYITSDFIRIPSGKKIVLTCERSGESARRLINASRAALYSVENVDEKIDVVEITSEIPNNTGADVLCRFSRQTLGAYEAYINIMAEIMDVGTESINALGLKKYYPYGKIYPEKIKIEMVPTTGEYVEDSELPINAKVLKKVNINYQSPLKGKKIMFFGDSFTNDDNGEKERYHTFIKNRTECETIIHGLRGSNIIYYELASILPMSSAERLSELSEECDMIVIFGGINDSRNTVTAPNNYKIGTYDDEWSDESVNNSLYASLKHIVDYIISEHPGIPIVALLPPVLNPNGDRYTNYNAVCEAEKEVYINKGIPYLDLRSFSTISATPAHITIYNNSETDIHWSSAGHERASHSIQKFLENYIF